MLVNLEFGVFLGKVDIVVCQLSEKVIKVIRY